MLDIGCGTGANIAAFPEDCARFGIDISAEAIRIASQRFPGVRFVCGSAPDDLPEEAREADLVLCMDVLEHIADDSAFFSTIATEAKAGCHLLITVPAFMHLWSPHDESFGHLRRYDLAGFRQLWDGLPFTERLVTAINSRLYLPVRLMRAIGRRLGVSLGSVGTDFRVPWDPVNRALAIIFAGESRRLCERLDGEGFAYARGVSLLALLRRQPGAIARPSRSATVPRKTTNSEDSYGPG